MQKGFVLFMFWTQEKYDFLVEFMEHLKMDWREEFGELDAWDPELKRYLTYWFNAEFGSNISSNAICNRLRKYLSQKNGKKKGQASEAGINGRVHSPRTSEFKLSRL